VQVNIAEAKVKLSELVQKAMLEEEVLISRDNKPLLRLVPVELVPIEPVQKIRVPGSGKW
jgi:prevent-host-death family protein